MRYEEQRLRYAEHLRGTVDPLTGNRSARTRWCCTGNFAPRIGLIYDWTKEGRSKIYGHWGRFYESIPMDINDRSFGGEVSYQQTFTTRERSRAARSIRRSAAPNGIGCLDADRGAGRASS